MKRFLFILGILFLVILIVGGEIIIKNLTTPQKTHYHAGFVVFDNGKKLDFSDTKYMFLEPCVLNSKHEDSAADIQIEKAHLHDNVGDVVHIERTGAKWSDLFTNIHFPLNYAIATGFINGKEVPNFQNQPIKLDDSLVVFIGKPDLKLLSQAVTKDYIENKAKTSTTCGD